MKFVKWHSIGEKEVSISENFLFFNLTVEPGPWLL